MFSVNFEPRGNIRFEKKSTAILKDSSLKEERYSEMIFTFIFVLEVARIFSDKSTKYENWVVSLLEEIKTHTPFLKRSKGFYILIHLYYCFSVIIGIC
jgi:hypothetical protein